MIARLIHAFRRAWFGALAAVRGHPIIGYLPDGRAVLPIGGGATNRVHERSSPLDVVPTSSFSSPPVSGDAILLGQYPGVALTDERADSTVTAQFDGVFDLAVRGHDGSANAAISAGDRIYYDVTNDELDVDTSGVPFGIALDDVASGATTTIRVAVVPD